MTYYRCLIFLCSLMVLPGPTANAGPNLLTSNWISCYDNGQTRTTVSTIALNSECLYQELDAQAAASLELVCDTRTSNFASAELAYSDQNFQKLRSQIEVTRSDSTLRVNAGSAPQNTRYAVVAVYADNRATMNCSLTAPGSSDQPTPAEPVAGECIDPDNDGFGWNGVASCVPDNNLPTTAPCVDSDNDGYGWNGIATCVVQNSNTNTSSNSNSNSNSNNNNNNNNNNNGSGNQSINPPDANSLTDLILITGQSNAQGNESNVSLAILDAPDNKVFAFTDENGWQVADLRQHWDGPAQQRHPGANALIFPTNVPHNNFAIHFGKSLVSMDPSRVVGFVLATAPGAGIKYWDKGSNFYNTVSNKAMTALNASNKSTFDGILWHQGETDFIFNGTSDITASQAERVAPNYYPDKLNTLINNFRQEPWFTTAKPVFICGETQTSNPDPSTIAPVNRRLMALNSDSDRYTGCVSAQGLQTSDGTHFDAAALREIGRRYATMYRDLKRR